MKRIFLLSLLSSLLLLNGCATQNRNRERDAHRSSAYAGRFGYQGEEVVDQAAPQSDSLALEQAAPQPTPAPAAVTKPVPPPPPVRREAVYGIPVPGKPGFVTSPYAPNSGLVDVRGYPQGTEVRDPYTDKIFLVP